MTRKDELIKELFDYCEASPINTCKIKAELNDDAKEILGVFADFILLREKQILDEVADALSNNQPYQKDWVGSFDTQRVKRCEETINRLRGIYDGTSTNI